jgi:glycosyltransferase involved in cell wall biosynthesis
MKVLVVSGIYPPDIGGPATHASDLVDELGRRGHRVGVLTLRDEPVPPHPAGVTSFPRHWPWPLRYAVGLSWLVSHRREYDVVYATGTPALAVVGSRLARRPVVLKVPGDPAWERSRRLGLTDLGFEEFQQAPPRHFRVHLMRALRSSAVRWADAVVTPSRALATAVGGWAEVSEVRVVPNGVRLDPAGRPAPVDGDLEDGRPPGPLRAVSVGRLVSNKGVDVLIDAVTAVEGVELDVVGSGPELDALRRRAARNGVADRVRFSGALPHALVLERLAQSDVFVSASSYEGLPHTHLEALAAGLPVVAADRGGTREVITHGVDGWLLDAVDADAFASALGSLRDDRPALAVLADGARQSAASWGFDRCADQIEDLLEAVRRPPRPRAVFVGKSRPPDLADGDFLLKLAAHRPWLDTTLVSAGRPAFARGDGVLSISVPGTGPKPLGSALFYSLGPSVATLLAAGRRPSVVVCKSPYEAFFAIVASRALPRRVRPPVQVELHGEWTTASRLYGTGLRRLLSPLADRAAVWSVRRADRIRAVSQFMADTARSAGSRAPIDIHIAHSDFAAFLGCPSKPIPYAPDVLCAPGVLEPYKGVDVLMAAWPRVLAAIPDARLRIVGSGPQGPALRLQAERLGVTDSVVFGPRVSRTELRDLIDASSCVAVPSRSEGLCRLVLEVMARARPVVATFGAMAELVSDGETGWLVPAGDPEALAARLIATLTDHDAAARMGRAARLRAESRNPSDEYREGIARLARWTVSK